MPPFASRAVRARYEPPGLPRPFVRRPRVEARLGARQRRPVTLVSGVPGAGKTTLATSWARSSHRRPAAWIGLRAHDNEPGRFAHSVATALGTLCERPRGFAVEPGDPTRVLDEAFARLGSGRAALVLDDAHELRAPEALTALGHLLERAPEALAVVVCARADPPVALGRLRLSGRLGEIRNADLEFVPDEASSLFAAHGLELARHDTLTLWSRTQGWAAGLRLAACALEREPDAQAFVRSAAATEEAVADYLVEELLARQDADVQSFLMRTSIVDRLTPDLAAWLADVDESDAHEQLGGLERIGVVSIDPDGPGYRYHALFAQLLRACLRHRMPEAVPELHRRAARWNLDQGHTDEAEVHARAGGDWRLVGRLAGDRLISASLEGGGPAADLVADIPPATIATTLELALVAAASACQRGDRDGAELYRNMVDDLLEVGARDAGPVLDGRHGHRRSWVVERAIVDLTFGWIFGADGRARAAATALRDTRADDRARLVRRLAALREAELDVDDGRFDAAVCKLQPLADARDGSWVSDEAAAVLALVESASGVLHVAEPRVRELLADIGTGGTGSVTASVARAGLSATAQRAAHLAAAVCRTLRGEPHNATEHLAVAEAAGAATGRSLDAVMRALRAAATGRTSRLAWLDHGTAHQPLAELALVSAGVLEVIDPQHRLVALGGPGERAVVRARQELASGAIDAALVAVSAWLANGVAGSHPRTLLEAHTLAVVAAAGSGNVDAAHRHLRATLDLVASSGIRAPLLDHGAVVAGLLERDVSDLDHGTSALDLLDRLRRTPGGPLVEQLTDRETAVLQHLPTLMSNTEIAAGMHLSVNTVKSHLKAVYRKLGVAGRRQAVLRARELELI